MDPFIGEIRMFGGNYAPQNYAVCGGQTIAISQNEALFSLLGTMYGGDGQTTFNLPDLRGRAPMHRQASGFPLASQGGSETVTLTAANMPAHTHNWQGVSDVATTNQPQNNLLASASAGNFLYEPSATINKLVPMASSSVGLYPPAPPAPLSNMQPFLAVTFIIALYGIYPQAS
ncbi:MAG: phage tail protein [Rhodocyclaceae bacterium]|nr:phage tail protein [Rhodocyclaceae bacterium]